MRSAAAAAEEAAEEEEDGEEEDSESEDSDSDSSEGSDDEEEENLNGVQRQLDGVHLHNGAGEQENEHENGVAPPSPSKVDVPAMQAELRWLVESIAEDDSTQVYR